MTNVYSNIAARLRSLGVSERAASLSAGLRPDAIRDLKRAKSRNPSYKTLHALAIYFNCEIDDLMGAETASSVRPTKSGKVGMRIDEEVTADQASRIFAILSEKPE